MEVYKYIGSGIVAWLLSVVLAFAQSSSPQELVDSFKSLHDDKDLENILILFETKDAAPIAVDSITEVLSHEFENNAAIDKVAIQEIDREQLEKMSNGYHYNGKLLVPTVANLTHTMKVTFSNHASKGIEQSSEVHFGKTDSGYMFTLSKLIDANK